MGLEPTNLLTASQALYQLSYAPVGEDSGYHSAIGPNPPGQAQDPAGPRPLEDGSGADVAPAPPAATAATGTTTTTTTGAPPSRLVPGSLR
jgi:hypothetical protein